MSRAFFFQCHNATNPTTNTLILERSVRFLFLHPDHKISWWNFPQPGGVHSKPRYTWIGRVSGPLVTNVCDFHFITVSFSQWFWSCELLCSCLLLICHYFFYSLVYVNVYHFTAIKILPQTIKKILSRKFKNTWVNVLAENFLVADTNGD